MTAPTLQGPPSSSVSPSSVEDHGPSPTAETVDHDALAVGEPQDSAGESPSPNAALTVGAEEKPFDAYRTLIRLLIGAGVEGAELALRLLQEADAAARDAAAGAAAVEENENDARVRAALIGLMLEAAEIPRQGIRWGWRLANATTQLGLFAAAPVTNSRLAAPFRRRLEEAMTRGQAQIEHWIQLGRDEEPHSRALTRALSQDLIEELIHALAQDPSIRMLVQVQGDTYIEYLQQENPEAVATLVQGQSLGMAEQILEEVRERTVTGDSLIETIARALLRRPPRAKLPPSPPEIKAHSDSIRVRREKRALEEQNEAE